LAPAKYVEKRVITDCGIFRRLTGAIILQGVFSEERVLQSGITTVITTCSHRWRKRKGGERQCNEDWRSPARGAPALQAACGFEFN
jgi:hypothetical protein